MTDPSSTLESVGESDRIKILDGWRGVAILCVLLHHFFHQDSYNFGRLGVDMFFALSGMLMAKILFKHQISISQFLLKRFIRIYPAFFVYVVAICLFSVVWNVSKEHENIISILLFLRSYFPAEPNIWSTGLPIGHIWSLNVEAHCYVLLAILAVLHIRNHNRLGCTLVAIGAGSIALNAVYHLYPELASQNYQLKTEVLASHIFISAGYSLICSSLSRHAFKFYTVNLAIILTILSYTKIGPGYTAAVVTPFTLAIIINDYEQIVSIVRRFLNLKLLGYVGTWSYSIYLWQHPFYEISTRYMPYFLKSGGAPVILSITLGYLSYRFIENTSRRTLYKIFVRPKSV